MDITKRRLGITILLWICVCVSSSKAQTEEAICQTYLTVGGVQPAPGTPPYLILFSASSVSTYTPNGEAISVAIIPTGSSPYQTLLLQAQAVSDGRPVGTWDTLIGNSLRTWACQSADDSIIHVDTSSKPGVSFTSSWNPPAQDVGDVQFRVTIGETDTLFWFGLASNTLSPLDSLCNPDPCQNSGICSAGTCACSGGYSGNFCETAPPSHPCNSSPCLNNGICFNSQTPGVFICVCPAEYIGTLCETPTSVDACSPSPCQNSGACFNSVQVGQYICDCVNGYTGDHCEIAPSTLTDPCNPNPCLNNGQCVTLPGRYLCSCPTEFLGTNCETPVGLQCIPECLNSGQCVNGVCMCINGYSGNSCEREPCNPNPCLNSGSCLHVGQGNVQCTCVNGFSGDMCELEACAVISCQNGGICSVGVCQCFNGFSGEFCDIATHPCSRPCTWPPTPMTCRYTFTIEWLESMSSACFNCPSNLTDCSLPGCIPMNGVRRPVVSVNQQIPGPPIEVCEDDTVVVKVWNELGNSEGTSIHWHALHHRGTQYMDGATMITQCPISAKSSFTYKFKASPGGSHWYHGHSQFQRLDGLYGSLVIKQAPERDINSVLYNYDLPEHVFFVQGWTNEAASPLGTANVKSFIINGKGRFDPMLNIPREVFKVKQGEKYRFRLMANNACHVHLRVQSHNLTVIATDASPIQPIVVDSIGFRSGERYDFVITADQPVDNYWFRIEYVAGSVCRDAIPTEYAILRYEGAPDEEPQQEFDAGDGVLLNPATIDTGPNSINLLDLNSAVPDNPRLLDEPDNQLYLSVRKHDVSPFHSYNAVDYPNPQVSRVPYTVATINNNFFKLPSSPLLTQMNDISEDDFCTTDEALARKETCFEEFCMCIQVAKIGLNETVELVIVSERGNHPMHLHGHFVQFVGQGQLYPGVTLEDVKEMDERGEIPRKLGGGILRDTFRTEKEGYTIVRFIADNPGQWFFHCHDIYHLIDGMEMVFQVGEMSDLPPIPKGFPRCGSWSPEDGESEEEDKGRKDGATAPARDEKKLRKQL